MHRALVRFLIATFSLGVWITAQSAPAPQGLDRWDWRLPYPQGNDLRSAVYGNGTWVVGGVNGALLTSTNQFASWRVQHLGRFGIESLAYGNGAFVLISDALHPTTNSFCVSTNGIDWIDLRSQIYQNFMPSRVAFGNGRFLALLGAFTFERHVGISSNGFNWQWLSTGGTAPEGFSSLVFAQGQFVGDHFYSDGTTNGIFSYVSASSNGVDWIRSAMPSVSFLPQLAAGGGRFNLFGVNANPSYHTYSFLSAYGSNWTSSFDTGLNGYPASLGYGSNHWIATLFEDDTNLWTSLDATNWTPHVSPLTNGFEVCVSGGGQTLLAGNYGNMMTATNDQDFTVRSGGSTVNLRSLADNGIITVAVGNEGTIRTSFDRVTWTPRLSPTALNLRAVAWGMNRFVIAGADGTLLTSTNGLTWTALPPLSIYDIYSLAVSSNRFVAVGDAIYSSTNGLNWSQETSPFPDRLNAVTWTGDRFVAVGRGGAILLSTDGVDWIQTEAPLPRYLQGVAYGQGIFVAVGQNLTVAISINGLDWIGQTVGTNLDAETSLEDVFFAEGMFVAVGSGGVVLTSTNGENWHERFCGALNDLRSVRHIAGRFIVAGNNETIMESGFYGSPRWRIRPPVPLGQFPFEVLAQVGRTNRVLFSDNLLSWQTWTNFVPEDEVTSFLETDAASRSRRFFRVTAP